MSEYKPGTHLTTFGTVMIIAIPLSLVVATGYSLMKENSWSLWSITTVTLLVAFVVACIDAARGSRRMPARDHHHPTEIRTENVVQRGLSVQEATFTYRGEMLSMDEWLGLQA